MATTSYGSPYVSGSDLVAAWPAASLTVANAIDAAGYYIGRGINAQTASYTGVLTDAGKTVTMTVATSNTFTVPLNATVAYPTGTRINILNLGAGACTVTATGGVTISGTISALATNSSAAVIKTATNTWSYVPFGSGAPAVIGSTTGSPTITTSGTATIYTFTGDGTLVVSVDGLATLLVVGPGGGGGNSGNGGGGGGGAVVPLIANLPAATYTIKVGAGGAAGDPGTLGTISRIDMINAIGGGGGGGGTATRTGTIGSSTGGGSGPNNSLATRYGDLGFQGGNSSANLAGGGGGASAVGANAVALTSAGAGGAGTSSTISGASVAYGGGGGGGSNAVGVAGAGTDGGGNGSNGAGAGSPGANNRGGGGGGSGLSTPGSAGAGGSGVVIVRVG